MEKNSRNQTTSFLMAVGIIFIVISGTIFISTAWQYVPLYGKQCIIFVISVCLFAGAKKMEKIGQMEKTEAALYYLAVSFLGLFSLSMCGYMTQDQYREQALYAAGIWNANAVLIAGTIMFIPVVLRFVKKRKAFDFMLTALLADWIIFWFIMSNHWGMLATCILSSAALTAYALADFLKNKWIGGNKRLEQVFLILYIIHGVSFVLRNLSLTGIDKVTYKAGLCLMAAFAIGITTLCYFTRKHRFILVGNSLILYWFILTGVNLVNELLTQNTIYGWDSEMEGFISFFFWSASMVIFCRKEMIGLTIAWGLLAPISQLYGYGGYHILLLFHVEHKVSVYLPFTGVLIVALLLVILKKYIQGKLNTDSPLEIKSAIINPFAKIVIMQLLVMCILFYASKYPFWQKGLWSILLLQNLTLSLLFQNTGAKIIFKCYGLFYGEILAFICGDDFILTDYQVEKVCLFLGIGIFLLGIIFNHYSRVIRTFQFICACLIMTVMLYHNVFDGHMGSVLILGITGFLMLVCAAMKGSQPYMILSCSILILMAFYITRSFWFSIEWWVYLFAAGVALVGLAIKKEKTC